VEYCCFNGKAFPQFDFTANFQYGRHALSFVLVQVTVNDPLVRVKLLRAINGNLDTSVYVHVYLNWFRRNSLLQCVSQPEIAKKSIKTPILAFKVIQGH